MFNWPYGKVFLGDGGAYLIGAILAWVAILAINRHDTTNIFSIGLLFVYPIVELLSTIGRRLFFRRQNLFSADDMHFHSLVYKLLRNTSSNLSDQRANNLTSVVILTINGFWSFFVFVWIT